MLGFHTLPNELKEVIFLLLPLDDLMECRCVCQLWLKIIDCDVFWIKKFSQKNLDFATSVQNLPICFYRDIYDSQASFKNNLVRNGDCSMKLFSQSPNKFPYWLHVGNFHSTWSKKLLGTTSILLPKQLEGTRACFSAELTHGPNEMHQKIRKVTVLLRKYMSDITSQRTSSVLTMLKLLDSNDRILATQRKQVPEDETDRGGYWTKVVMVFEPRTTASLDKILVMFLGDHILIANVHLHLIMDSDDLQREEEEEEAD
ncbi:hypothetical protein TCAL_15269 [Tigriopus californicus]|uniref:F-box domain-containing protein n=1 Tax=Tigriopus californicus TaxID=6832 RepID=A0A553NCP7_TIGCA|nr:hypothetical protein TCAL_15269 [Tigriopus californicus]